MTFIVSEPASLVVVLQMQFKEASKTSIKQWIAHGRVKVNSKVIRRGDFQVPKGAKVELLAKKQLEERGLEILYEDEHLVVVNKPINLLSVAADIEKERSVHRILKNRKRGRRVFPVHRIDKETSGVLVFAYTELARAYFKELFFTHLIKREYLALVEGKIEEEKGVWKSYLLEDDFGYVHKVNPSTQAKEAITLFQRLKLGKTTTLIALELKTGRKNQIRVHAKEAGHPIVGDSKYGASLDPYHRLMLHAQLLGFKHPITKKEMVFTAKAPQCFFRTV